MQHTKQAAMKGQFEARQCANLAYGAAGVWKSVGVGKSVGFQKSFGELFAVISKESKQRLDQFKAQEISNTAWAFATVGHQDEELFKAVAKRTARRLDQFIAQNLANTAWAFATVGQREEQLFRAVAKMAE